MDDSFKMESIFIMEGNIMYTIYKNFRIKKAKNFVQISTEGYTELENANDEWIVNQNFPKVLEEILYSKISLQEYDTYCVYTLNISNPNRITDYKKIWHLANLDIVGIYDNFYDGENGRIYFGVSKEIIKCKSNYLLDDIYIFVPKTDKLKIEVIFDIFKQNCFDINLDKEKLFFVLSSLQKLLPETILVYQSPFDNFLNIHGNNVDIIFNEDVLPKTEIMEK